MMYPNPAYQMLQLHFPEEEINQIQVYDVTGQVVLQQYYEHQSEATLDINALRAEFI